jgi:hypothetical protein
MKKQLSLTLAALCVANLAALAQTINVTVTAPVAFNPAVPSGGTQVPLNSPISLMGVVPAAPVGTSLVSVSYVYTGWAYANYNITGANNSAPYTVNFSAFTSITGTGLAVSPVVPGIVGAAGPFTAPSAGTTAAFSATAGGSLPAASFTPGGNFSYSVPFIATSGIQGPATDQGQPDVFGAARISLDFTFRQTDIPEPSTYAGLGFVLAAAGWTVRRRFVAKA